MTFRSGDLEDYNYMRSQELDLDLETIECSDCQFPIEPDDPRAFHDLCNACHEERNPLEYSEFHSM